MIERIFIGFVGMSFLAGAFIPYHPIACIICGILGAFVGACATPKIKFDPLMHGEEPYQVRNRNATHESMNDADMTRMRVIDGGTPGKINYRKSDPRHPHYRRGEHADES